MNLQNSRDELPQYFKEMGYTTGAEVGVYLGEFIEKFCKAGFKMYGIDPYAAYDNYRKHPQEQDFEKMYWKSKELLESHGGTLIRKTSMEALNDIPDDSLDFVYIDANHSIRYAVEDIYEWYRKVRVGGVISGHDYFVDKHNPYWIRACHVKLAVDACVEIFKVKDLQVIGEGDRHPSWLWIKESSIIPITE
jgi:hypothetical protein